MPFRRISLLILIVLLLMPSLACNTQKFPLAGWDNRIEITIDHDKLDSDLAHFPLLIHLSKDCGKNGQNLTAVFDEVGENSKKIAVTKDDGITQLYVEIEKWDEVNKEAWLWVSKSDWSISSTLDTTLYLYYDNHQNDNSSYIGDSGSAAAAYVWDSHFKGVWHLNNLSELVLDSTGNNYDGTNNGADVGQIGQINGALSFNGSNDTVTLPVGIAAQRNYTVEVWAKTDDYNTNRTIYSEGNSSDPNQYFEIGHSDTRKLVGVWRDTWGKTSMTGFEDIGSGINYIVWVSVTNRHHKLYLNASVDAMSSEDTDPITLDQYTMGCFKRTNQERYWDGIIDELRLSDTYRSEAWIKATYCSSKDNLIYFQGD